MQKSLFVKVHLDKTKICSKEKLRCKFLQHLKQSKHFMQQVRFVLIRCSLLCRKFYLCRDAVAHCIPNPQGAPRLSLTKYFCDRFSRVSLTIFLRWLAYLDVAIAKNSRIYSTRLHASFANFSLWLHLNYLAWFYKRGKCQWNSRGICHIFMTIFCKTNCELWSTNFFVSESWVTCQSSED